MKQLYFVRHGESEFNRTGTWTGSTDVPLSKLGIEQAKEAGKTLQEKGITFDIIISSPLERAHNTARYIAEAINYPEQRIVLSPRLVERNFGELEGNMYHKERLAYEKDESAIDAIKNVEPLGDLQTRANNFLNELYKLPYDNILVVGHGAFARALYRSVNLEPITSRGYVFANAEIVKLI